MFRVAEMDAFNSSLTIHTFVGCDAFVKWISERDSGFDASAWDDTGMYVGPNDTEWRHFNDVYADDHVRQ
jgi:hypothetical protein